MTATLEAHWRDHAKMLDQAADLEANLHGLQGFVERKWKITAAVRETEVKKTSQPVIRYLDLIDGSALTQNRDLTQGMRAMQRELNVLEAEQM
jgi:hypothetical protein